MLAHRFLAYLALATFGMGRLLSSGRTLLTGGGNLWTWLEMLLALPLLALGLLATARILYWADCQRREDDSP